MEIIAGVSSKHSRYPWDEWFDGQPRRASHAVDFFVSPKDFGIAVRKAAKSRDLQVIVTVNTKRGQVDFQAILPSQSPAPAPAGAGDLLVSVVGP